MTFHNLEGGEVGQHGGMVLLFVKEGISAVVQDGTYYRMRVAQFLTSRGQESVVGIKNGRWLARAVSSTTRVRVRC